MNDKTYNKTFQPTVRLVRRSTGSKLTVTLPRVEYQVEGDIRDPQAEGEILADMVGQLYPTWQVAKVITTDAGRN
jgi:hypothetical protein